MAAYDTYNYSEYWEGREYEHESEVLALKSFLKKIPKIKSILEVGAGFGRLTPNYTFRAKKVVLTDPSRKLLAIAKKNIKEDKVEFVQSTLENLPKKMKSRKFDLVVMVRVLHHINDQEGCFEDICKLLKKRGYFILEFANKRHFKAYLKEFFHGNFTYALDIFPKDIRSKKSKAQKTLPFLNFHPDKIRDMLEECGFEVLEERSVSNIRNSFLKSVIPLPALLYFEKYTQKLLSFFHFGPSIFYLARKRG